MIGYAFHRYQCMQVEQSAEISDLHDLFATMLLLLFLLLFFFLWVFYREIFNQSPLYQTNPTLSSVVMTTHRINFQYGRRRICYVWLLKYWAFNIRHNWMPQCVPRYLKSCVLFVCYASLL